MQRVEANKRDTTKDPQKGRDDKKLTARALKLVGALGPVLLATREVDAPPRRSLSCRSHALVGRLGHRRWFQGGGGCKFNGGGHGHESGGDNNSANTPGLLVVSGAPLGTST